MSGSKEELIGLADEFTSSGWSNSGPPARERLEASCDDPRGVRLVHRVRERSRSGESPHLRGAAGQSFCAGVEAHVSGSRQSAWAAGANRRARTTGAARCPRGDRPAGSSRAGGKDGPHRAHRRNRRGRSNRPCGAGRPRRRDGCYRPDGPTRRTRPRRTGGAEGRHRGERAAGFTGPNRSSGAERAQCARAEFGAWLPGPPTQL